MLPMVISTGCTKITPRNNTTMKGIKGDKGRDGSRASYPNKTANQTKGKHENRPHAYAEISGSGI